jgi:hypothetical protein
MASMRLPLSSQRYFPGPALTFYIEMKLLVIPVLSCRRFIAQCAGRRQQAIILLHIMLRTQLSQMVHTCPPWSACLTGGMPRNAPVADWWPSKLPED